MTVLELRSISFVVPGKPVAWARAGARAGIAGDGHAFVQHFTKPSQRPYAALIRDAARQACAACGPERLQWAHGLSAVAMELDIVATFARPNSHFTSKGALTKSAPASYTRSPDCDNLAKIVGDALNGILWHDDAQVVRCTVLKVWGREPSLQVVVSELAHSRSARVDARAPCAKEGTA